VNEKALEIIELKLDCITILPGELGKPKDFRLKVRGNAIELVTREREFLPDWKGSVNTDCYPSVLHLTKLSGCNVDLKVKIPEPEPGIDIIMIGLGKISVKFTFHKQGKD